jgi:hypothetical protein
MVDAHRRASLARDAARRPTRYYNDEYDVAGLCGACTAMQKEADQQADRIVETLGLVAFLIFVIWLFYQMPGSWFWTILLLSFFLIRNVFLFYKSLRVAGTEHPSGRPRGRTAGDARSR